MSKKLEQQHIEYHIKEITRAAKNLQSKLIEKNNLQMNPTKGGEIKPIPIFEPDQYNLLTFTKEILDTDIEWPETESTFLPAYFKKYLAVLGITETSENIANKISRGKFTAVFLVQCLEAIGCATVRLD